MRFVRLDDSDLPCGVIAGLEKGDQAVLLGRPVYSYPTSGFFIFRFFCFCCCLCQSFSRLASISSSG
jgi:hypothetical protein